MLSPGLSSFWIVCLVLRLALSSVLTCGRPPRCNCHSCRSCLSPLTSECVSVCLYSARQCVGRETQTLSWILSSSRDQTPADRRVQRSVRSHLGCEWAAKTERNLVGLVAAAAARSRANGWWFSFSHENPRLSDTEGWNWRTKKWGALMIRCHTCSVCGFRLVDVSQVSDWLVSRFEAVVWTCVFPAQSWVRIGLFLWFGVCVFPILGLSLSFFTLDLDCFNVLFYSGLFIYFGWFISVLG